MDRSLPPDLYAKVDDLERQIKDLQRSQNPTPPGMFSLNDVSGQPTASGSTMEYDRTTGEWKPVLLAEAGDVKWSASDIAPGGRWLLADGSAVSRSTYSELFTRIGVFYGSGDGSTTFNLPDLGGRLVLGAGNPEVQGATGGSRDAGVVSHTHTIDANTTQAEASGMGLTVQTAFGDRVLVSGTVTDMSTASAGSSGTGANMPPWIALWGYIRY